jgi:hypothetical protein
MPRAEDKILAPGVPEATGGEGMVQCSEGSATWHGDCISRGWAFR